MSERLILERTEPNGLQIKLYGKDEGDEEIYIDGAWGMLTSGVTAKINLYKVAMSFDEGVERREVVARLVMPIPTMLSLRDYLINQCDRIQSAATPLDPKFARQLQKLFVVAEEKPKAPKKSPKKSPMKRTRKPATKKGRKK
ncbi:MAG: hypothetical protein ACU0DI_05230 [Paracoccaceae bacterium]